LFLGYENHRDLAVKVGQEFKDCVKLGQFFKVSVNLLKKA
jgi:hypothetical protein